MEINLISDTVTKPTPGMLRAMMTAEVGDDVFKQDPTVNELEAKLAALFNMEAAMFFPSGTMANQTAIKVHTQPADQIICHEWAHVYKYEGGGASFNSGVSCHLLSGAYGLFTANQVEKAINPPEFYHSPLTTLVCIENTTNYGGGACWDKEELIRIGAICKAHNLSYHLDGARLFNAMVANDESPEFYGTLFDTISICLSKGLGAPVGSVLIGSKEHIKKALRVRKLFGGGMRQSGFLAAAGIYALDHHVNRLKEDHDKAKELGAALLKCDQVNSVAPVVTNIVIFSLKAGINEFAFMENLKSQGILISNMGGGKLRMVTHLDYTKEMHEYCLKKLAML